MTALFKVLCMNIFLYFFPNSNCNMLSDGIYKVFYTLNQKTTNLQLNINKNKFIQYQDNGDSVKGQLSWLYNCTFKLDYIIDAKKSDSSTEFEKLVFKSFGDPCFELKEKKGDTILFRSTYSGNLHLTTNEGMIIKIK